MTPLVFLPGAGGRAAFWRPVADRLADLGPAHLFAWPGFGDAPPDPGVASLDDLLRWLVPRLPEGASHVVAQSMGGVLAVRLALEHPGRVASLALVATSGGVDVRGLGGSDWRAEYLAELPRVPRWFVDDRTDLSDRLGDVRAPTLLLWGDADPVSPVAVGRHLAARLRGVRLEVVAGGTHAMAEERPEVIAAALRRHLAGVAAGTSLSSPAMAAREIAVEELESRIGAELGVSSWLAVEQDRIDLFARATDDHQWIHVDPERARQGPFGGTIAHGFLTLSLLPRLVKDALAVSGVRMSVNYGLDRVRFTAPLPSGARVRARLVLGKLEKLDGGGVQLTWNVTVEREGAERPCLVAEWLVRHYL